MRQPKASIPARLRATTRTGAFLSHVAGTFAAYELQTRALPAAEHERLLEGHRRRFTRRILRLFNVDWELAPWPPAARGGRLVLANHRSVLDIPLLVTAFGGAVVSRADVSRWPLLGHLAQSAGTIFVDRGDRASGAAAIRTIRRRLEAGTTVVLFPEGGTFPGDEVRPLQGGAFAAVRGLDVEIWPVGIAHEPGTEYVDMSFVQHLGSIAERPGSRVIARVGEPFRPEGNRQELAERTREALQTLVDDARASFERAPREHP